MTAACPADERRAPWPFVRTLIHLDVAESTNDVAKQLARGGRDDLPIAVWADRQTRGRGQRDRLWWSDDGSLTFSLLLDPRAHALRVEHEPLLALATAAAVADTLLVECGVCAEVRWPNDVDVQGRKLGGVLPERVETPTGAALVIGVGLNIATQLDNAPPEVRRTATSVRESMAAARPLPLHEAFLRTFLGRFAASLEGLVHNQSELALEWQSRNALLDQPVQVDMGTHVLSGIGRAIDRDGALCVEVDGSIVRLFGGRVLRS